jgi:hypothetical protein
VIYTALVVVMLVLCVALGAWGGERVERPRAAAGLALVMVVAQLALLLSR